jgi:hypothetical protein
LGLQAFKLSTFNKTINLAASGAGGMDTGAAPANGFVAIYAIYNPTTKAAALLAVNATTTLAPEVYGGANMPAGYTASCLLTVLPTNASSQLKACEVRDRDVATVGIVGYSGTSALNGTAISLAGAVPLNAKSVSGAASYVSTAAGAVSFDLTSGASAAGLVRSTGNVSASGGIAASFSDLIMSTPQIVFGTASNGSGGTVTYTVIVSGYRV